MDEAAVFIIDLLIILPHTVFFFNYNVKSFTYTSKYIIKINKFTIFFMKKLLKINIICDKILCIDLKNLDIFNN